MLKRYNFIFTFGGLAIVLALVFAVELEVLTTFEATYNNGRIEVDAVCASQEKYLYVFREKADIKKVSVEHILVKDGRTIFLITEDSKQILEELPQNLHIDVVVGFESLARRMFVKAGKAG